MAAGSKGGVKSEPRDSVIRYSPGETETLNAVERDRCRDLAERRHVDGCGSIGEGVVALFASAALGWRYEAALDVVVVE
jgi:hypothetical protein